MLRADPEPPWHRTVPSCVASADSLGEVVKISCNYSREAGRLPHVLQLGLADRASSWPRVSRTIVQAASICRLRIRLTLSGTLRAIALQQPAAVRPAPGQAWLGPCMTRVGFVTCRAGASAGVVRRVTYGPYEGTHRGWPDITEFLARAASSGASGRRAVQGQATPSQDSCPLLALTPDRSEPKIFSPGCLDPTRFHHRDCKTPAPLGGALEHR